MYSIKAVAQATGLTVETLRAWERRYRIVVPERDATGRRIYRPEDVLRLRRLREATELGHPIRRLAGLSETRLADMLSESGDHHAHAAANSFVRRILAAAQDFARAECEQTLTLAVATLPPQQLVSDVLEPLLREVGERWHRGELAISQERLVSSVVRRHLGLMLDAFDRGAQRAPVVFATLPGERHELGLLMSAMVCASLGCKVHYLGPDLPAAEIARYAREVHAAAVALSAVCTELVAELPARLRDLVAALPAGTVVWVGGAACRALPGGSLPERCALVHDATELGQRLAMLPA